MIYWGNIKERLQRVQDFGMSSLLQMQMESVHPFALMMYAAHSLYMMATAHQTTQCHDPEDHNLNSHCHEHLKN
jgi:hypothetical protein